MNEKGRTGEEFAVETLKKQGYNILAVNYHSRFGEVDIIASKNNDICFVEVKTRRQNSMVGGLEAVTKSKQKKIIATAVLYLQDNNCDLQPRFDVFSVETDRQKNIFSYEHIENAFDSTAYSGY